MDATVEAVFRSEWSRLVASLVRILGDFDLAEDAAQEAFATASSRWAEDGVPECPRAWLLTVARRKAVDRIRRTSRQIPVAEPPVDTTTTRDLELTEDEHIPDERLALIFMCCHPALSSEAQVALTLRAVAGLSTAQIAAAFLVPEPTMKRRLTRAKAKVRDAGIPFAVPPAHALVERLSRVLAVVYLIYTAGYRGAVELSEEAIRIGRILMALLPDETEVSGLVSLMLLQESRRRSREVDGLLVSITDQDRSQWDWAMIAEAASMQARRPGASGYYMLQARLAACYIDDEIPWSRMLGLFDALLEVRDSPIVRLNRAVVLAELAGPEIALDTLDAIDLPRYPWYHSTRAELLRRAGRTEEAASAYRAALSAGPPPADAEFVRRRLDALGGD